ncbi:SNF2 family N-terminal domain-containing protein [Biscogniauxia marginata]|nr:SNF2 family N-terminal domain-containing protein [Biscogniauxia marginata]
MSLGSPNNTSSVRLDDAGRLFSSGSDISLGSLRARDRELVELFQRGSTETKLIVLWGSPIARGPDSVQPTVYAILYGCRTLGPRLKDVLRDLGLSLQDPIHATRDVIYWNPQRFYNHPRACTSQLHVASEEPRIRQERIQPVALLAALVSTDSFTETEGPELLATPLQCHQRQALTFMINRERGWRIHEEQLDLWSIKYGDACRTAEYVNNIDGSLHHLPPPEFRGGVLADNMGAGKSLSMISLMANDKLPAIESRTYLSSLGAQQYTKSTLLVMPPTLLQNWKSELSKHLRAGAFSWRCHHGPTKIKTLEDLLDLDIVLISYNTLKAEWKRQGSSQDTVIFSHHWHRLILDEGHYIKHHSAMTTQAALALKADCRWVVTGTPIQNSLSEIQSLLCFIQVFPYSDKDVFNEHIVDFWGSEGNKGFDRLKRLLKFIMLRRCGDHIKLPRRTDLKLHLQFNDAELCEYRKAKDKTLSYIEDALDASISKGTYYNALQKIETLRQICNLGKPPGKDIDNFDNLDETHAPTSWDVGTALGMLHAFPSLGLSTTCVKCGALIDPTSELSNKSISVHLTMCLQMWCQRCHGNQIVSLQRPRFCRCDRACPSVSVPLNTNTTTTISPSYPELTTSYPTKIQALIHDLKKCPPGTKSIVFSFWKATLDVAYMALTEKAIKCAQVDGSVKVKTRNEILQEFLVGDNIQVLLLSLSCGAVGLTLTAATRAYLMEPQWNPSIEEQALARIHRIRQTEEVTTVRFIVEDTIEKYVMDVQDRKKDLVTSLLSPQSASSKLSHSRLKV